MIVLQGPEYQCHLRSCVQWLPENVYGSCWKRSQRIFITYTRHGFYLAWILLVPSLYFNQRFSFTSKTWLKYRNSVRDSDLGISVLWFPPTQLWFSLTVQAIPLLDAPVMPLSAYVCYSSPQFICTHVCLCYLL